MKRPAPLFILLKGNGRLSSEGLRLYDELRRAYGSHSAAREAVHKHGSYRAALAAAPKG